MKKYLKFVVALSLSVLYSLALAERGAAESGNKQAEPGVEQTERRKSSDDSRREHDRRMFEIQEATSGNTQSESVRTGTNKKSDSHEKSILRKWD